LFTVGTHLHWWFPKPVALLNCSRQKQQYKIGICYSFIIVDGQCVMIGIVCFWLVLCDL